MSRSPSRSLADLRHTWRFAIACALAALALVLTTRAFAADPVLTPPEVRTAPVQFIVVAVANPVTGRPAAVGGTAHGYGTTTNYRISASASSLIRELGRTYSLTLVSEWPFGRLRWTCWFFRIPPGTSGGPMSDRWRAAKPCRSWHP